jgi:hypothetical protein
MSQKYERTTPVSQVSLSQGDGAPATKSRSHPPQPPGPGTAVREIDRAFKKARRKCGHLWEADAGDLSTFLKATDSSSPPERLFLIQLFRHAGRQLLSASTVTQDRSEWYLTIGPPRKIREKLEGWHTEIWLEVHAQKEVILSGQPNLKGRRCYPDFLVKVQVNEAKSCRHVLRNRPTKTALHVAVEVDGKNYHYDNEEQIERDIDRHNQFACRGLKSLRCNAWKVNESERGEETDVGAIALDSLWTMAGREVLETRWRTAVE